MSDKAKSMTKATADGAGAHAPRPGAVPAQRAVTGRNAQLPPQRPATASTNSRRTLYLASWGVLALAASIYLAAATLKPQILAKWFPAMERVLTQPQGNDQNRSAVIAEAQRLRDNLEQAQTELMRLRQELGSRDARVKSAELRIAGLEHELQSLRAQTGSALRPGAAETSAVKADSLALQGGNSQTPTDVAEASKQVLAESIGAPHSRSSAQTSAALASDSQTPPPRSFELVNGAIVGSQLQTPSTFAEAPTGAHVDLPLPERRPPVVARVKPAPGPITQLVRPTIAVSPTAVPTIETGSVASQAKLGDRTATANSAAAPITFGTPVVTRAEKPVGIRLTAGPSVDALRLSWSLMSERYASELGGLEARYVVGSTPAAPYALVAGPFADDRSAQQRCASLIAKGIPCSVEGFGGNAL